jgi:hypothetical protein
MIEIEKPSRGPLRKTKGLRHLPTQQVGTIRRAPLDAPSKLNEQRVAYSGPFGKTEPNLRSKKNRAKPATARVVSEMAFFRRLLFSIRHLTLVTVDLYIEEAAATSNLR